jgi:hypothetical protein
MVELVVEDAGVEARGFQVHRNSAMASSGHCCSLSGEVPALGSFRMRDDISGKLSGDEPGQWASVEGPQWGSIPAARHPRCAKLRGVCWKVRLQSCLPCCLVALNNACRLATYDSTSSHNTFQTPVIPPPFRVFLHSQLRNPYQKHFGRPIFSSTSPTPAPIQSPPFATATITMSDQDQARQAQVLQEFVQLTGVSEARVGLWKHCILCTRI